MSRTPPELWIRDLVETATSVFTRQGYRRTQMADVAREMGVSAGSLYRYVAGKEALLDLVVQQAFATEPPPVRELPVPTPSRDELLDHIRARGAWQTELPRLRSALAEPGRAAPSVRAEVAAVVGELFDAIASHQRGIALLERCAAERPELAALYFGELRSSLLRDLERWIARRVEDGAFAPVRDPAATARIVIEVVGYFGWKRRGDPQPGAYSDATARECLIDLFSRALPAQARP